MSTCCADLIASPSTGTEIAQRGELGFGKANLASRRPVGVEAVHLPERSGLPEAVYKSQKMAVTRFGEVADLREIERGRVGEVDHHLVVTMLQQMIEHRSAPILRCVALGRRAVFDDVALVARRIAPAERATLIDRVQRIDDDQPTREFQPLGAAALAEATQQFGFGQAGEPLAGQPVHQRKARGQLHTPLWRAFVTSERSRADVAQPRLPPTAGSSMPRMLLTRSRHRCKRNR